MTGNIAGPGGEIDWIIRDPEIDFRPIYRQFDTALMGRRTFEIVVRRGGGGAMPGMETVVVSRTLRPQDYPEITIVDDNFAAPLTRMRAEAGKDFWLFGGSSLFRSVLDTGLVDTVEVAVIPVPLGGGLTLLPPPARMARLELAGHKVYKTKIVSLEYAIARST